MCVTERRVCVCLCVRERESVCVFVCVCVRRGSESPVSMFQDLFYLHGKSSTSLLELGSVTSLFFSLVPSISRVRVRVCVLYVCALARFHSEDFDERKYVCVFT